jgi:DNA-binding transcriptional MerR regulator
VRVAELSRRSGVTVPSIKYYLREGLLPPGEPTGRNQAAYSETHLQRLRLIRALREVGGLSVAAAGEVLAALDDPAVTGHDLRGRAHRAVIRAGGHDRTDPAWRQARADAQAWVREMGWRVGPDAPALDQVADVFATLRALGHEDLLANLPRYAEAALALAEPEVATAAAHRVPSAVMAAVAVGTVLGERLFAAVRLLAHEHVSAPHPCADQGETRAIGDQLT